MQQAIKMRCQVNISSLVTFRERIESGGQEGFYWGPGTHSVRADPTNPFPEFWQKDCSVTGPLIVVTVFSSFESFYSVLVHKSPVTFATTLTVLNFINIK